MHRTMKAAVALVAAVAIGGAATAHAESNRDDARKSVEEKGGRVVYGKEIDHAEYAKAALAFASGNGGPYLLDLAASIAKDTGLQLGLDVLNRLAKGETFSLGGKELQAGIVTYNHWRVVKFHTFVKWKWKLETQEFPLPNTHQFYLRVK